MATLSELNALASGHSTYTLINPNVYHTGINANALSTTLNDTGWIDLATIDPSGKICGDVIVRLEGNTTISAGAISCEGSHVTTSSSGTALQYELNNSGTISSATFAITSASVYNLYITNPSFRYIKIRVSTAFTGAATGVRATNVFYLPRTLSTQYSRSHIVNSIAVTGSVISAGDRAHSAVDSGNPVKVGGKVVTTHDSTLAAGDRADLRILSNGALAVYNNAVPELQFTYLNTISAATDSNIILAQGGSVRAYITHISLIGTSTVCNPNTISLGEFGNINRIWNTTVAGPAASTTQTPWMQTFNFSTPLRQASANTDLMLLFTATSGTPNFLININGFYGR